MPGKQCQPRNHTTFLCHSTLMLHSLWIFKTCLGEGGYHCFLVFSTLMAFATVVFDYACDASAVSVVRVRLCCRLGGVAEEFDGGEET